MPGKSLFPKPDAHHRHQKDPYDSAMNPKDQQQIELFMRFLEGREVLFAGMDDEVQAAVVIDQGHK
jgi:hypothetical protein